MGLTLPHQRARTLDGLLEGQDGAASAIIDHDGTRFSYGELADMVAQAAGALGALGIRPGDRVLLVSENCALYAAAVFALNRLRAWIAPVNARHTPAELVAIAEHSGARAMIFTTTASPSAAQHANEHDAQPIADLSAGPLMVAGPFAAAPEPVERDRAQEVAALMYTTGTTSAPKGVMLTNANLTWNARTSAILRDFTAADEVLGVLPGTHIFGFASTFLSAIWAGAAIRFLPRFSASAVLDAFEAGVT
ncbi:MAG: AMP-binding protein, partial [Pseudomonadota bacterium]